MSCSMPTADLSLAAPNFTLTEESLSFQTRTEVASFLRSHPRGFSKDNKPEARPLIRTITIAVFGRCGPLAGEVLSSDRSGKAELLRLEELPYDPVRGWPTGIGGWFVRAGMNRCNARLNSYAFDQLQLVPEDRVVEVGFGGGTVLPRLLRDAVFVCSLQK